MTPILVFDIETIPDAEGLRKLWDLAPDVSDAAVVDLASQRRRQATGSDFLPPHLHRVVAISCALRERDSVRIWSLGTPQDTERDLVQRFFDGIEKYTPQLVSWNGSGFDLPVLNYRALVHSVRAPRFWDMGDDDREFRYNNYISRYHMRHCDLMDILALYQPRANAPLDEIAQLLGLPGKLGMDGSQVWGAYQEGRLEEIRNYCETDVVNTYLVFLRFQLMRGVVGEEEYRGLCAAVRSALEKSPGPQWPEFLQRWREPAAAAVAAPLAAAANP
jgi:predicted PolB exonuclease-like 3'-5' exonuclease